MGLGSASTKQIKRMAKELIRRFPDRFSNDFEKNKQLVNSSVTGGTPKVRNLIAGYITRCFARAVQEQELPEETIEETEKGASSY
jgi:small subunit ribosomal protein S17e